MGLPTYQLVVTVELERLDDDGAMAWRGSAKQASVGTLPELQRVAAECSLAGELAQHLVKNETERQHG